MVVLATVNIALLSLNQHAHCTYVLLSAKEVHVSSQIDFYHPHMLSLVIHKFVTKLVASSQTDYVAIFAQQNVQRPFI